MGVSFYMFYQITPRAKASKSKGREAAKRFQQRVEELRKSGRLHELESITNVKYSLSKVEFDFFGALPRTTYPSSMDFSLDSSQP